MKIKVFRYNNFVFNNDSLCFSIVSKIILIIKRIKAKDCIQRMIKVNPAFRITSSELFEHPWFLVIFNFTFI